jgi:DNA repair exonuclease SbcCD ATPase subunit
LHRYNIITEIDILIIDEGFGSADEESIKKMEQLFEIINENYNHCILISHLNDIKNKITNVINVIKD